MFEQQQLSTRASLIRPVYDDLCSLFSHLYEVLDSYSNHPTNHGAVQCSLEELDLPTTTTSTAHLLQPRPLKTRLDCHRRAQWQFLRASTDKDGIAAILHDPRFRALVPR
jgi:hypothetical protein